MGQVTGRTRAAVAAWLNERGQAWRDAVEVVAIDSAAPYRTAVRQTLPRARILVDHFHLVALANKTVTRVRQRVTRERLGRRGRNSDPAWANRRLLLRGRERLSDTARDRQGDSHAASRGRRPVRVAEWVALAALSKLEAAV